MCRLYYTANIEKFWRIIQILLISISDITYYFFTMPRKCIKLKATVIGMGSLTFPFTSVIILSFNIHNFCFWRYYELILILFRGIVRQELCPWKSFVLLLFLEPSYISWWRNFPKHHRNENQKDSQGWYLKEWQR